MPGYLEVPLLALIATILGVGLGFIAYYVVGELRSLWTRW